MDCEEVFLGLEGRAVAAVAEAGGEAMRPSFGFVLRAVAAEQPTVGRLGHLRALLIDFVERHGGADELAAQRSRAPA